MFHSPKLFLTRLVSNYGSRFCWLLTSVYLGLKGPVYQMTGSAQLPYFKSIGVTGQMYQSYGTVAMTPWAMKAAIGMISDSLPVFGYHKKPYMIGASGTFRRCISVASLCAQLRAPPFDLNLTPKSATQLRHAWRETRHSIWLNRPCAAGVC